MTRDELLEELRWLQDDRDPESAHAEADRLLLAFIDDPEVTEAYRLIDRWYA